MIRRDIETGCQEQYDVAIVGGGIQGVMCLLEACRRNLRAILIERDDFGGATSWNSLRIVHGGLRYLQSMNLNRFRSSVAERAWLLQQFPDLIKPLPCLMPLYDRGVRRRTVLGMALSLNDALVRRWTEVGSLPSSRLVSTEEVVQRFPDVRRDQLKGGAIWHDGYMSSPQRLIIELIHWADSCGATAWNYVEASTLNCVAGRVSSITAVDRRLGKSVEIKTSSVINCAGPWSQQVALQFDRKATDLFTPALAFNVLVDRAPLADFGLAVSSPKNVTYFLVPCGKRQMVGTFHASATRTTSAPTKAQVQELLDELNEAVPKWSLSMGDVLRVHAGVMPARSIGSRCPATNERIVRHDRHGGPHGLLSVSGVKFTTARATARHAVSTLVGSADDRLVLPARPCRELELDLCCFPQHASDQQLAEQVRRLVRAESVLHLDDLILRRTSWGDDVGGLPSIASRVFDLVGWEERDRQTEVCRVTNVPTPNEVLAHA